MKRIKIIGETVQTHIDCHGRKTYLHPILYMLKTYHDNFGKSKNDYEWLRYEQNLSFDESVYDVVEKILIENVDIVCFSVYVWGNEFLHRLARKLKNAKPDLIVIMGGPDITARTDSKWFKNNPHVDYVVYSDGEKAFSMLLDHLAEYDVKIEDVPNLIYQKNDTQIINKFEVLRDREYFALSPWQHCADIFEKDIINFLKQSDHKSQRIIFSWERARGCPYSCSFCDWNSGLHNKVTKRTYDYKKDIDLFCDLCDKLGITAELSINDANLGMFEEDFQIFEYILSDQRRKKLLSFDLEFMNFAKNHKERVFRIWDLLMTNYDIKDQKNFFLKISQQDMNDYVLKNIERPSIPWQNIKNYVLSRREKFYDKFYINSSNLFRPTVEIIAGLPGQTKDSWYKNLLEISEIGFLSVVHPWVILPYSPANDIGYQEKFKIKSTKTFIPYEYFNTDMQRELMIESLLREENSIYDLNRGKNIYKMDMVTETYSFNLEDLLFFHLTSSYYNTVLVRHSMQKINRKMDDLITVLNTALLRNREKLEKITKEHYDIIKEDLNKYNCIFFSVPNKGNCYDLYTHWFYGEDNIGI